MSNVFVVEQKSLLSILAFMQPICSKRTALDVTTSILFTVGPRELVLKSTDLEISFQASYELKESSLKENLSFLVNGKRLFDIVKELDSNITFTIEKTELTLQSGPVHMNLNIKDAEEFPPLPERIENFIQFEVPFLRTLLDKVSFLIPQSNANPALNGLYLEMNSHFLTMTTTDGHCLVQVRTDKYTLEKPQSWLLPRRAILELKKILDGTTEELVFLGTCSNQLVFSGESFNFFTKLLSHAFPEYKAILNRNEFKPATIDRSSLVKTLRRSSCLLSGQFIATSFGFQPENVQISMHNKEVGKLEESVSLKNFEGNDMVLKFYAPYLLQGLSVFDEGQLTFYLNSSLKPIIFESGEKDKYDLIYLVMPVSPMTV